MYKFLNIILLLGLLASGFFVNAQVRVIDNKGTVTTIDPSKWTRVGVTNDVYNKYPGNVGIGISSPVASLHNSGSTILGVTLASNSSATYTIPSTMVDAFSGVVITQTGSAAVVTLSVPTNATAGRHFTIVNAATSTFPLTINNYTLTIGASGEFVWNGSTWSSLSTVASVVPFSGLSNATAINTIDNTAQAQTWGWTTATTQNALTMNANALTTGTLLGLNAAGLTSGSGMSITSSGSGLTGSLLSATSGSTAALTNGAVHFNLTGAHTGNGVQIDDATITGNAMAIQANSLTLGNALTVSSNGVLQTGSALAVVTQTTATPTNGLVRFNFAGDHSGIGFQLDDVTSTGSAQTINATGIYTGTGLWNLNANNATIGTIANINANSLTDGTGFSIASTGAGTLRAGSLLKVSGAVAATTVTNGLFSVVNTASSSAGTVATIKANATPGSGLTVLANGNIGVGVATPGAALHIEAGTAALGTAPLKIDDGSVLTTIEKGTIEKDANVFYATPDATNRGVLPAVSYSVLSTDYALGTFAAATPKNIFPSGQGTINLAGNTTYEFEAIYYLTNRTTSHTTATLFGGTAVETIKYSALVSSGAVNAVITTQHTSNVTVPTARVLNAASTAAETVIQLHGIIWVTTAGTFIPQIQSNVALTAGGVCQKGSFFKLTPIGNSTVTKIGSWM